MRVLLDIGWPRELRSLRTCLSRVGPCPIPKDRTCRSEPFESGSPFDSSAAGVNRVASAGDPHVVSKRSGNRVRSDHTQGEMPFSRTSPLSPNHTQTLSIAGRKGRDVAQKQLRSFTLNLRKLDQSTARSQTAWARRCPSSEHTDASSAMGSELSKAACAGEVGLEVHGQTYLAECSEDDSEPDCS